MGLGGLKVTIVWELVHALVPHPDLEGGIDLTSVHPNGQGREGDHGT